MGVDSSSGKVWLSMRQVLPDPLQETLDALLAQGPPSDPSQDGVAIQGSTDDMSYPGDLSYPEDEASMVCVYRHCRLKTSCCFPKLKELMSFLGFYC